MGLLPSKLPAQLVLLCIPTVLIWAFFVFPLLPASFSVPFQAIEDSEASPTYNFGNVVYELYRPIKLPVTAESYTDQRGNRLDNGGRSYWKTPMGKNILIVDIDTRLPGGENEVFNDTKMDWGGVKPWGSGLLTVSHVNHFFYCERPFLFAIL